MFMYNFKYVKCKKFGLCKCIPIKYTITLCITFYISKIYIEKVYGYVMPQLPNHCEIIYINTTLNILRSFVYYIITNEIKIFSGN